MNRAEKRRQQKLAKKLAKKAAGNAKPGAAAISPPGQPALAIQQALDLALRHHRTDDLPKAKSLYLQVLQADPNQPVALHLLGLIALKTGENNIAFDLITKAIAIRPDYAEAHCNLGNLFHILGKPDEAVASFRKATAIKPDYAEAHCNLGNEFHTLGNLDEALASYRNVLAINPDDAGSHYNLGAAFHILGNLDEAVASYHQALAIEPDRAEAHYNLHALLLDPGHMTPSIKHMERAVKIRPDKTDYRFMLGMLLEYSGDPRAAATHFDRVESGENSGREKLDAWRYIKSAGKKLPPLMGSSIQAFKLGIDAAPKDGLVLEFGVRFGTSIRQIAALVDQKVHGFDSFEGIPESWFDEPEGSYSTGGVIPPVPENVILHKGWFEDTLPGFVENHQDPIRFINIDCDIYSSTKTVLEFLATQIIPGTVMVFDEYIGNEGWREDEFKAFQEAVFTYGWNYEYLGFSFMTKQVVVRIK